MIKEIQVRIVPEEAANEPSLKRVASRETVMVERSFPHIGFRRCVC